MPKVDEVIKYLRPNAEWVMYNDSIDELTFLDDATPISKVEYDKGEKELADTEAATKAANATAKAAILERLGLTEEEVALLLA
jgi:hypothetical protein